MIGWAASLLVLALVGCASSRMAQVPTPPDPPPIPGRKPAVPVGLPVAAALSVPQRAAAVTAARLDRGDTTLVAYRVRPGDTVYGISRRLSVPLRGVIDANGLGPPYVLSVGQILRIPNPRRHVVQAGDTVYGISRRYGVDMTALVRLNRIASPYTIAPGDRLILPVWTRTAAPDAAAGAPAARAVRPPRHAAAVAAAPAPSPPKTAPRAPARLAAIPKPPPRAGGKFLWPARGKVIATYGPKKGGLHNDGINIAAPRGAPVRAAENGVVVYRGNELRGFGNLILIKHADGWVTAYAHNETFLVRRGDRVRRGQTIAKVGSTGNVSRPQLHFEIRKGTRAVDPRRLLGRRSANAAPAG
ncbi:MAG: peptidoglycan DD-metalloendopeptidase family protein [Kiloniellaceae bacterium]